MATNLNSVMPSEEMEALHASWTAESATSIMITPEGKVLLGTRTISPQSIPEAGDIALVGGFNFMPLPEPEELTKGQDNFSQR